MNSQTNEAIEAYTKSVDVIKNKLKSLKEAGLKESEEEIKELEGLIPDLEEKIEDMKSYKEEVLFIFVALNLLLGYLTMK